MLDGVMRDAEGISHHGDEDHKVGDPGLVLVQRAAQEFSAEGRGCLFEHAESCIHLEVGCKPATQRAVGLIGVVLIDLFWSRGIAGGEMHIGEIVFVRQGGLAFIVEGPVHEVE